MSQFYRVRTHHQTYLHRLPDGRICHLDAASNVSDLAEVLIYAPDLSGIIVFLVADSDPEADVTMVPETWRSSTYPLRRIALRNGAYGLAHPYSGHYILAPPKGDPGSPSPCVISENWIAQDWEAFTLEAINPKWDTTRSRGGTADRIVALAAAGLQSLLASTHDIQTIEAVARVASQRDFELTAQKMLDDPALSAAVLKTAQGGPYPIALQNLLSSSPAAAKPKAQSKWAPWRKAPADPPKVDYVNDARLNKLIFPEQNDRYMSFAEKLSATARRQRLPIHRLCALATARNEGPYFIEWIAYHRLLGVEHFFICSNDNDDGSDELLSALQAAGVITWIPNTGTTQQMQLKAYCHALGFIPEILNFEWVAVLDLDEFVMLKPGGFHTIPELLAWEEKQPVDVVALAWSIHWSSGNVRWSEEPTLSRFRRQNHGSSLVKSIFRPRKFTHTHPHHPLAFDNAVSVVARDSLGDRLEYAWGKVTGAELPEARIGEAWMNHYFSRSAEEYLWKWFRSASNRAISKFNEVPDHFVKGFVDHHTVADRHSPDGVSHRLPALDVEMDRIMQLPKVADAMATILHHRREQAKQTGTIVQAIDQTNLSDIKKSFLGLLMP